MMLVKILGFGSNWWARFGHDPHDRYRYTRDAAYFNSTGVRCGQQDEALLMVPRLDSVQRNRRVQPHSSRNRVVGEVFECADLAFAGGGNRVLFRKKSRPHSDLPDYFLLVVSEWGGAGTLTSLKILLGNPNP